jgi:peptide-methionine (S)-S-oxide reductase
MKATFAAGCFWGVESLFAQVPGVTATRVGYMGGWTENPSYEAVCRGDTGHAESLEVEFDPNKVTFEKLVEIFFENHDPTTLNKQGPDVGTQYRSAIFCEDAAQLATALDYKEKLDLSKKFRTPIATQIVAAEKFKFYPAEDYHQRYFEKQGMKPCAYNPKDNNN